MRPRQLATITLLLLVAGCGPSAEERERAAKEDYSRALQTYQGEVERLESLQDERQALLDEMTAGIHGLHEDFRQWERDSLATIKPLETLSPAKANELEQKVAEKAETFRKQIQEASDAIGKQYEEPVAVVEAQIKEQESLVQRAKADLDAADKARK